MQVMQMGLGLGMGLGVVQKKEKEQKRVSPLYFLRFLPDDLVRLIIEFDGTYRSVFGSYSFGKELKNYYYASPSVRKLHIHMITTLCEERYRNKTWVNEFYDSGMKTDFKIDLLYEEEGVVKFKVLPKIYHIPYEDWEYFDGFICNHEKTKELEYMIWDDVEDGVYQFEKFLYHGFHAIRDDVAPLYDMISEERMYKMIRERDSRLDMQDKWYLWAAA